MIRLSGTQRELMEILWENEEMTLHALTKAALGNAVTPNRTDAIRVVLLQMVTKGAVAENTEVSPHIYTPLWDATRLDLNPALLTPQEPKATPFSLPFPAVSAFRARFSAKTKAEKLTKPKATSAL